MSIFSKIVNKITNITKYTAIIIMAFMMVFLTIAIISRTFLTPFIGDREIAQSCMVIMIMGGLVYTQQIDGHISIGLIVDKLSEKVQKVFDVSTYILTFVVTMIIAYIYINVSIDHMLHTQLSTTLLEIPRYPFDFFIALSFLLWGVNALLRLIESITPNVKTSEK